MPTNGRDVAKGNDGELSCYTTDGGWAGDERVPGVEAIYPPRSFSSQMAPSRSVSWPQNGISLTVYSATSVASPRLAPSTNSPMVGTRIGVL